MRRLWIAVVFGAVGAGPVLFDCVGDAPSVVPALDSSTPIADTSPASDTSVPVDAFVADAAPCSNPLVGNVLSLPSGGALPIIPGSSPLIAGNYTLTLVQLDCNGGCGVSMGSILGGLKVSSSGPGQATVERRIELQQADAGPTKLIDTWVGTFDQLNRVFQLGEVCPGSTPDAGWLGGFPTTFFDGGTTGLLKIRFPDVRIVTSQGAVTALLTFTKQ